MFCPHAHKRLSVRHKLLTVTPHHAASATRSQILPIILLQSDSQNSCIWNWKVQIKISSFVLNPPAWPREESKPACSRKLPVQMAVCVVPWWTQRPRMDPDMWLMNEDAHGLGAARVPSGGQPPVEWDLCERKIIQQHLVTGNQRCRTAGCHEWLQIEVLHLHHWRFDVFLCRISQFDSHVCSSLLFSSLPLLHLHKQWKVINSRAEAVLHFMLLHRMQSWLGIWRISKKPKKTTEVSGFYSKFAEEFW